MGMFQVRQNTTLYKFCALSDVAQFCVKLREVHQIQPLPDNQAQLLAELERNLLFLALKATEELVDAKN